MQTQGTKCLNDLRDYEIHDFIKSQVQKQDAIVKAIEALARNQGQNCQPNSDKDPGTNFDGVISDLEARAKGKGGPGKNEGFHPRYPKEGYPNGVPDDGRIYPVEIEDELQSYEVMHQEQYKRLKAYELVLSVGLDHLEQM
jgi:hypothetical protein